MTRWVAAVCTLPYNSKGYQFPFSSYTSFFLWSSYSEIEQMWQQVSCMWEGKMPVNCFLLVTSESSGQFDLLSFLPCFLWDSLIIYIRQTRQFGSTSGKHPCTLNLLTLIYCYRYPKGHLPQLSILLNPELNFPL